MLLFTPIFYLSTFPEFTSQFNIANFFFNFIPPTLGGLLGGILSDKFEN